MITRRIFSFIWLLGIKILGDTNTDLEEFSSLPLVYTATGTKVNIPDFGLVPELKAHLYLKFFGVWNTTPISRIPNIIPSTSLKLMWDPPSGHFSHTTLALYVEATFPDALVFYEFAMLEPNITSPVAVTGSPYIQLQTPFEGILVSPALLRNLTITLVAVRMKDNIFYRSQIQVLHYFVEGQARKNSYGFLVPGVETSGKFVRFKLEEVLFLRYTFYCTVVFKIYV